LSPASKATIARRRFVIVMVLAACDPSAFIPEDPGVASMRRVVINNRGRRAAVGAARIDR
jgi:hypothetical protein